MRHWVWRAVGGCCGLGLWWVVVEVTGADQDAWWAVMGRIPSVMAGMAAVDRAIARWR
ncbi:hypothetical protein [Streptomyces sp. LS1784]|uniref:hypothetical protein n=2 Tax=Streptomycetaceae TaxID=2062 RepID=UPI001CCEBD1E|nr:hypothetical protein [Streptomyces sp. LS1784]